MNNKSSVKAFFLSFIPGLGHFYVNKKLMGFLYFSAVIFVGIFALALTAMYPWEGALFIAFGLVGIFVIWLVNMFDMILFLLKNQPMQATESDSPTSQDKDARFQTILLSFVPGLGHFHLGLMNRGLTFLIGFIGLGIMIIFITAITNQGVFIVFLGVLPAIWIYNMFDTFQQLAKKERGEPLIDRTVLEDFEDTRQLGKKSKTIATILSMFPGAGHMYLGLQKRGLQLMAAFLFAIYILDTLRLSIFLFLIPLIWFYSFFDALQKASKSSDEDLEDIPIVSYFISHQKWLGIGLIMLGAYYMFVNIFLPAIGPLVENHFGLNVYNLYYNYFQMIVVCTLLIGGGLKLLVGSKVKKESV
ncbi:hypothetical protein [Bacillus alkalisoli]|uniref:hypothetical protein n=1 Tax=Bacillus alkalisoli TaxID=2011008 RepID=UPI000C24CE9C|nr:hypothetical protein [Bacillus alkalisoli]